jgi:hypothetical protein
MIAAYVENQLWTKLSDVLNKFLIEINHYRSNGYFISIEEIDSQQIFDRD